ncbi:DUF1127 domain-containing protein [Ectopseudomonas guguanensis]|jgi:uncharacterized protein YjiS (DUF1127 family)|uniref:DUF1127 domain-containing protein n=1 Tax=Ectopseudomonas guguanensis TaxID=1198456 RepID=UPI003919C1B0
MERTQQHLAQAEHGSDPRWLNLYARLRQWQRNRRTRQQLALLDDRQLADAGISSAQREQELAKPFWR